MSARVLLNILNEFGKRDFIFAEYFIFFRNEFNKLKNIGARMLDFIYHMTLKLLLNRSFA